MNPDIIIDKTHITCESCGLKFERGPEYKHCSNCFACTGCEIYYCPRCDTEIVITPCKPMRSNSDPETKKA